MQSAPSRYWENSDVDKSQREHDQHVHMSLDSLNIYVYIYPLVFFYRFAPINHDSYMIHHPKPSSYLRQPGAHARQIQQRQPGARLAGRVVRDDDLAQDALPEGPC